MVSGHLLQCERLILNRLLHLRRVAPLFRPGGPADKFWLWPLLVMAALLAGWV